MKGLIVLFILASFRVDAQNIDRSLKSFLSLNQSQSLCQENEGPWCENLFRYACDKKVESDGTDLLKETFSDRRARVLKSEKEAYRKELKEKLKEPAFAAEVKKKLNTDCWIKDPSCLDKSIIPSLWDPFIAHSSALKAPKSMDNLNELLLPSTSPLFDKFETQTLKRINENLRDRDLEKNLKENIFPQIKSTLISQLESMFPDRAKAQVMFEKISKVEFGGIDCQENLLASWNQRDAYYTETDGKSEFYYCAGFLNDSSSVFRIAYIMAHELAHSIDPCKLVEKKERVGREKMDKRFPASDILQCLRSPSSLMADYEDGLYSDPDYPVPESMQYCMGDEINETYADWMAAQILPKFLTKNFTNLSSEQTLNGYTNIVHSLDCQDNSAPAFGPEQRVRQHPHAAKRVNRILMSNPQLRNQVGCLKEVEEPANCQMGMDLTKLKPVPKKVKFQGFNFGSSLKEQSLKSPAAEGCFH